MDWIRDLASKKAAVIFSKSSCCMCLSIKTLFYDGGEMERALRLQLGSNTAVPAVFVGGKYVGSAKDIISCHVDGSLKQMLKDANSIWL